MMLVNSFLLNVAGKFANVASTLIVAPLMIHYLGMQEYALIAFGAMAISYGNVFDAGLSPVAASRAVWYSTTPDRLRIYFLSVLGQANIKFARWFLLFFAMLFVYAVKGLDGKEWGKSYLVSLCLLVLIDAYACVALRLVYAVLQGAGRHLTANLFQISIALVRSMAALLLAMLSHSVVLVYAAQIAASSLLLLAGFLCVKRVGQGHVRRSPEVKTFKRRQDVNGVRHLTLTALFIAGISGIQYFVVSSYGGKSELTHYFLAVSLGGVLSSIQAAFISALIPEIAASSLKLGQTDAVALASRLSFYVSRLNFAFCGLVFVTASPLTALWISKAGVDASLVGLLFKFQVASIAFVALTIVAYAVSITSGHTNIQLYGVGVYFFAALFVLPVARSFGGLAEFAAAACALSILFSIGYYLFSIRRTIQSSIELAIVGGIIKPVAASLLPCVFVSATVGKGHRPIDELIFNGVAYSLLYLVVDRFIFGEYIWSPIQGWRR